MLYAPNLSATKPEPARPNKLVICQPIEVPNSNEGLVVTSPSGIEYWYQIFDKIRWYSFSRSFNRDVIDWHVETKCEQEKADGEINKLDFGEWCIELLQCDAPGLYWAAWLHSQVGHS